jgi:3-carboxy-cis,cis-muconate cycloisomerase
LSSSGLFTPIFVPDAIGDATSDRAFLQAMLDAEVALARAQGLPDIADACRIERFDVDALGAEARRDGNPVPALVRAIGSEHAHQGATSQDILDTAAMLVAKRAIGLIEADLSGVIAACERLIDRHSGDPITGRTLLQAAQPTTFGGKVAGWRDGVAEAYALLRVVPLTAQLGGPVGALDDDALVTRFAELLGLLAPERAWHTNRVRIAQLGSALAIVAGALAKIALDVELMSQTEVGEVEEPQPGGSSSMPHKRNPVGSVVTRACARRVAGASSVLTGALEQEHERAAGAWHAEWEPLREALTLTGGAASAMRSVLEGLRVFPDRMRANLERSLP